MSQKRRYAEDERCERKAFTYKVRRFSGSLTAMAPESESLIEVMATQESEASGSQTTRDTRQSKSKNTMKSTKYSKSKKKETKPNIKPLPKSSSYIQSASRNNDELTSLESVAQRSASNSFLTDLQSASTSRSVASTSRQLVSNGDVNETRSGISLLGDSEKSPSPLPELIVEVEQAREQHAEKETYRALYYRVMKVLKRMVVDKQKPSDVSPEEFDNGTPRNSKEYMQYSIRQTELGLEASRSVLGRRETYFSPFLKVIDKAYSSAGSASSQSSITSTPTSANLQLGNSNEAYFSSLSPSSSTSSPVTVEHIRRPFQINREAPFRPRLVYSSSTSSQNQASSKGSAEQTKGHEAGSSPPRVAWSSSNSDDGTSST